MDAQNSALRREKKEDGRKKAYEARDGGKERGQKDGAGFGN